MNDMTFLPGPNLRVARNDSGMSMNAEQALFHGVEDKVDPLVPASYADDVHTNSDGSKVRVQRAKPAPLPENATLQDRLRRYSPINGYARYCAMAADKIDEQEKELQAARNLNLQVNSNLTAMRRAVEQYESDNMSLLRRLEATHRLYLQATEDLQHCSHKLLVTNQKQAEVARRGFLTRLYHAFKGEKA